MLDDVHRAHRQPGTVHQTADLAVELDVRQPVLARLGLGRALFVEVTHLGQIAVSEERVVVEVDLAVERHEAAIAGDDQRIDLGQGGIGVDVGLVQAERDGAEGLPVLTAEVDGQRDVADVVVAQPDQRVDVLAHDRLWIGARDLLDLDAAFRRTDDHRPARRAIVGNAKIDLFADVGGLIDQHLPHRQALDRHRQDLGCQVLGLFGAFGQLDATGLAAPADEHLALDHHTPAQLLGDGASLGRRACDLAFRDRHAMLRKQRFRLVFVKFQNGLRAAWLANVGLSPLILTGFGRLYTVEMARVRLDRRRTNDE